MGFSYNSLTGLLKNKIIAISVKPPAQIDIRPIEPIYDIASPPKNIDTGIKPCEPIFNTLETLPNLSLSMILIIAVEEGTLIRTINIPIKKKEIIIDININNPIGIISYINNNILNY